MYRSVLLILISTLLGCQSESSTSPPAEALTADAPTKEALRYSQALLTGFQTLNERPLITRTAEEICSLIKGREMRVRKIPGTAWKRLGVSTSAEYWLGQLDRRTKGKA